MSESWSSGGAGRDPLDDPLGGTRRGATAGATSVGGSTGPSDPSSRSTRDVAQQEAGQVASSAADRGREVAGTAKEQAGNVASEAGHQAKDLLAQARSEVSEQAGHQTQRLASTLRSLGEDLRSMADGSREQGPAAHLARSAAERVSGVASWMDGRQPSELLDDVRSFAARRPGAFLALAAGAGLLAGRLTRGVKDASSSGGTSRPTPSQVSSTGYRTPSATTTSVTPGPLTAGRAGTGTGTTLGTDLPSTATGTPGYRGEAL